MQRYELNSNTKPIQWVYDRGNRPPDEPSCGFDNELCPKPNTQLNSIIASGVLLVMLFCLSVIIMSCYRKWKIEQEIEGLLWKIDRDEIQNFFDTKDNLVSSPSRVRQKDVRHASKMLTAKIKMLLFICCKVLIVI